jgi:hypothetical protein
MRQGCNIQCNMQHAAYSMQHTACCSATAADAEQNPFRKFGRDVFEFRMGSIGAVTQVTLHLDEPSRFFGSKMGWSVTAILRAIALQCCRRHIVTYSYVYSRLYCGVYGCSCGQ